MFTRLYEYTTSNERYNLLHNDKTPYVKEVYSPGSYVPGTMLFFTGSQFVQIGHVEIDGYAFPFETFDMFNPLVFTTEGVIKMIVPDSDTTSVSAEIQICRVDILLPLLFCENTMFYPYANVSIDYKNGTVVSFDENVVHPVFSDVIVGIDPAYLWEVLMRARGTDMYDLFGTEEIEIEWNAGDTDEEILSAINSLIEEISRTP